MSDSVGDVAAAIVDELGHLGAGDVRGRAVVGAGLGVARLAGTAAGVAGDDVVEVEGVDEVVEGVAWGHVGEALAGGTSCGRQKA